MASSRYSSDEVEYLGERPAKRPRGTISSILRVRAQPAREGLDADLRSLTDAEAKKLLIKFAPLLPALAQGVKDKCDRSRLREGRLIRKYDEQVERAAELANSEITSEGSYDKTTILSEVKAEIRSMLKQIVAETKPHSSYQSKFNAVESMLEIFEAVLYKSGEVCHELIGHYNRWDSLFGDVFACFHDEELRTLAAHPVAWHRRHSIIDGNDDDVGWLERLQEFVQGVKRFGFVPGVEDVYETLYNAVFEDPSEEESLEEDNEDGDWQ
ncbi:hypothetical protein PG997_005644 [Apiospora hydei]|uniref:Uncharacterized protein n=1 Tax=Apiospora hydei TaxID=1337664 RepID=A0ABR1WLI5_9PEZI